VGAGCKIKMDVFPKEAVNTGLMLEMISFRLTWRVCITCLRLNMSSCLMSPLARSAAPAI